MQPSYMSKIRTKAHGVGSGDGLVVLADVAAPGDAPHDAVSVLEDVALLPDVALGQLPNLDVGVRSHHQAHGVIARFAPGETVHRPVHLEGRIALPVPNLKRIHRLIYIHGFVLAADRLRVSSIA